jgi:hypothetical protein
MWPRRSNEWLYRLSSPGSGQVGRPKRPGAAASRVHPRMALSASRSRSSYAPIAPLQLVSVSHSYDHTFVQPLQEPSPTNLRPWLNACPLWPEANTDTIRQHRPSRAFCLVPIRSTLSSTHRCVKQVNPIVMLLSRPAP